MGQVHVALHDHSAAVLCFNELLAEAARSNLGPRRPAWATAHIQLAELEPETAEAHWRQAWSIDPQTAAESCLIQRRESSRVLETFQDAACKRPWDWYAQANYGLILMAMKRPAEAAVAFRAAFRLSPQRPALGLHWAMALYRDGKTQHSLEVLNDLDKTASGPLRRDIEALRRRITQDH
jgi:predicted Zn-dependent protease